MTLQKCWKGTTNGKETNVERIKLRQDIKAVKQDFFIFIVILPFVVSAGRLSGLYGAAQLSIPEKGGRIQWGDGKSLAVGDL